METYIVAEVGSNHGGSLEMIKFAIREYSRIGGVSAIKLQWASDGQRMAARRGRASEDGYGEAYKRHMEWPEEWHAEIAEACRLRGVDYICSVFLPEDVAVVAPHVAHFKIASFEAMDPEMLKAHGGYERQVLISTGMLNANEVSALRGRAFATVRHPRLLYCISSYPAPVDAMNLAQLWSGDYAGLSDHSLPEVTITGALAVAAGATVIEAHVRIPGQDWALPDSAHSMTEPQFIEYINHIRTAESAMGEAGERRAQDCEASMCAYRVVS